MQTFAVTFASNMLYNMFLKSEEMVKFMGGSIWRKFSIHLHKKLLFIMITDNKIS